MGNCGSGLNKAFLIAFDLARQPICAGRRTNHGKDRWRLRHTALARLGAKQAIDPLLPLLEDENTMVQETVEGVLASLGWNAKP